jgi:23S rRNA (cytidine1920-2'-O)/16S rRNA (cytidine1409-2'-O)-methyltransferase
LVPSKIRLDTLLVQKGLFTSREKARAAVISGQVMVNDQKVMKPGAAVDPEAVLTVLERLLYVSRGGLKLEKALRVFHLDLKDKIVLDVGASTGGFTDCALAHGARLVYAVDVGYGQLAWKLRISPQVVVLERTNIRYLSREALLIPPNFAVIDVSFISLAIVLPKIKELTTEDVQGVALIKPQFEAGQEKIGKKGVVRDPLVHQEVIAKICSVVDDLGWTVGGLDFSPLKGPEGNIEYLIYFAHQRQLEPAGEEMKSRLQTVVQEAHLCLNNPNNVV